MPLYRIIKTYEVEAVDINEATKKSQWMERYSTGGYLCTEQTIKEIPWPHEQDAHQTSEDEKPKEADTESLSPDEVPF